MKIAIDASQVVYGTGVSRYTKNLISSLIKLDSEDHFYIFGGTLRLGNLLDEFFSSITKSNVTTKRFPISPSLADLLWNRVHRLKIERLIGEIDVFHSSDWSQPPTNAFSVTTIHDLTPVKTPELSHPKIVRTHRERLARVKKDCNRIIVPSEATKADLLEMGFHIDKIRVIPEAPDRIFTKATANEVSRVKKKYSLPETYLLSIGVGPRKNTNRIISAVKETAKTLGCSLVIVGGIGVSESPTKDVKYTGYVSENDLPAIYTGATALVYTSLYEGFGLPILEAFSCGVPVITSNLGSMKEISKSAAVLVDPESVESISQGILEAVKKREYYQRAGFERSLMFTWESAAESTLSVYRENI
jgi:glycosyltransferase involved in cell wall biosynthesis